MNSKLSHAISAALKEIRVSRGLSQESLALIAALDRTYISGIERGTRNPTIKSVQKVIDALNVDERNFLELVQRSLDAN
jgi:transcriptional regulator with XRE-family HTH domain